MDTEKIVVTVVFAIVLIVVITIGCIVRAQEGDPFDDDYFGP